MTAVTSIVAIKNIFETFVSLRALPSDLSLNSTKPLKDGLKRTRQLINPSVSYQRIFIPVLHDEQTFWL